MPIPEEIDSPYDPQWVQDLVARYPQISSEPWTVTIRKGWLPIVEKLMGDVVALCPEIRIVQVKEKFGGLRIYQEFHHSTPMEVRDVVGRMIYRAMQEADHVCEVCGAPGELRATSWRQTLCDSCHKAYLEDMARTYGEDVDEP